MAHSVAWGEWRSGTGAVAGGRLTVARTNDWLADRLTE